MSQIRKKFIKFGTGTDDVNSRALPAHFTPTNYTPTQVASEGNDKTSAHLNGIDAQLGTVATVGDIAVTSFSAADNQATPANVTGLAFANGSIRAFEAILSVTRGSTYAVYNLMGIQKAASWEMSQNLTGDDTGLTFSITTAGQVQYISSSTGDGATVKFRAKILPV